MALHLGWWATGPSHPPSPVLLLSGPAMMAGAMFLREMGIWPFIIEMTVKYCDLAKPPAVHGTWTRGETNDGGS